IPSTVDRDGTKWTRLTPPVELPMLGYSASSYDRNRGVVVVFGGFTVPPFGFGSVDWTYEWNGSTWSRVNVPGPPAREFHAMTFDRARGVAVMFGGQGVAGYLGDTWTWNGTAWTQVASSGPGNRILPGMAYDVGRARV